MRKETLIAYASSFVSFLLDEKIGKDIDKIILFGSVAKGEYDEESDIDLFIDTKKDAENEIKSCLSLFLESENNKKWQLKGLRNELSIKTGDLDKWKLKRDIITDGIMLYGKYTTMPQNTNYYLLVVPSFKKFKKVQKIKIWRKLHGYKQRVGKKIYTTEGLIKKVGGKRIETGIVVPMKNKKEVIDFLNKEKVSYTVNEIWSDSL